MASFLLALLETGVPIFIFASFIELKWRKKKYGTEFTRKTLHIIVGIYAAFWPWFISWGNIQLLAVGCICALLISRRFKIFNSMHLVERITAGEFLAVVSAFILPFITHSHLIFATSVLVIALADGFAGIVGTKYGKGNKYMVFGQTKSIAGTLTFYLIAVLILMFTKLLGSQTLPHLSWGVIPLVAAVGAIAENLAIFGSDDLLVPIVLALILKNL